MATYQNPNRSGDSLPPSLLNWGDSLEPQDEPPADGSAPASFGAAAGHDFLGSQSQLHPQVQHAVQPHPFAEPQPYVLEPPPLHDMPPAASSAASFSPSFSSPGSSLPGSSWSGSSASGSSSSPLGLSYGYAAQGYTGPEPPVESRKARAALWIGILGGWLPVNLVVGLLAIVETGPGRKRGRDKAVIGLCCSLVWVVLVGGIAYAVQGNRVEPAPQMPGRPTALAGGSDPGCYTGAQAVYAYQGSGGGAAAETALGNALVAAAGRSQTADAPLRKLGLDYLALAHGADVPGLAADTEAVSRVCGLSFKTN